MPDDMLEMAAQRAYGGISRELKTELRLEEGSKVRLPKLPSPTLEKMQNRKALQNRYSSFNRGDSVTVYPEQVIGIVVKPEDDMGNVLVQVKKEKRLINHRRLKLKVAASQLYPEDYDFSIIFDSVENRKARHQMGKHHMEGVVINAGADGE